MQEFVLRRNPATISATGLKPIEWGRLVGVAGQMLSPEGIWVCGNRPIGVAQ
jgi:hypothetical protein